MAVRDEILDKVRNRLPLATELPGLELNAVEYPDPFEQFSNVLSSVGGVCLRVPDHVAANEKLADVETYATATRRYSAVEQVGESTVDLSGISDPHDLADIDFAVLPGELAVAENAAIWVATDDILHRTLYFVAQHLAIVVPSSQLVSHLHAAYQQIDVTSCRFGTFVSGPSKTADIEQSLVIGAHGARSLTVLLVDA